MLAEEERVRADDARHALEQVQSDRALSEELDELNMQMGTLWFGMRDEKSVAAHLFMLNTAEKLGPSEELASAYIYHGAALGTTGDGAARN